ncbi:MAG: carboxyltransferase domain-containing protein, partial [Acidimicrobiales bacterium]
TGLGVSGLQEVISGALLEVAWIGFMPGFAYLSGLPPPLSGLDRLVRPRTRVPAGAVALAGGYAGIYAVAGPAGWNVVGRTDYCLFDSRTPPYAVLQPGDEVLLVAIAGSPPGAKAGKEGEPRAVLSARSKRRITVISPGLLTAVQDRGRSGVAHLGVPPAGVFDTFLAALANVAAGNPPEAATFEIAGGGLVVRAEVACAAALAGGGFMVIDGRSVPAGTVQWLGPGELLEVPALASGARAYLALSGGIEVPATFGSRSTDLVTGLGVGPIRAGDQIGLGGAGRARGALRAEPLPRTKRLRVLAGPDKMNPKGRSAITSMSFAVSAASDRTGVRLSPLRSPRSLRRQAPELFSRTPSHAVVTGSVQLTSDGSATVLGPDHGTTGGYLTPFTVITADIALLAQLLPGDEVALDPVEPAEARAARRARRAALAAGPSGWLLPLDT